MITTDAIFEAEVIYTMDELGIDYAQARCAVAEKAAVAAIVNFGVSCRGLETCSTVSPADRIVR